MVVTPLNHRCYAILFTGHFQNGISSAQIKLFWDKINQNGDKKGQK